MLDNQTPAVVEKPKNTIIYQGQRSFSFVIPTNLFYDPKDTFSIYVSPWYYGDTIITNNYDTQPDDCKNFFDLRFSFNRSLLLLKLFLNN